MTNATWIEPPPQQKGMGCFAKGCLILIVFGLVLMAACFAGVWWGYRHYSALLRGGVWASKTRVIEESPKEIPAYDVSREEIEAVQRRWDNFEMAVDRGEAAEIEFSANDLNALLADNRHLRGRAFFSIEGSRLRFQMSLPLEEYLARKGYYANADIVIQFDGAQSIDHPQVSRIIVNGEALPSDVLDWKYDSRALGNYLAEFHERQNVATIDVREGKLILRSRGRGEAY